ncbi:tetratricopeptide repeat protein [Melioribacteraceae bacterium 4301-Me]|uniref:tetratricopeptide repeat protein n=1 Tax=Pyranulibacter aquaticus TaxID=3163344 RepID=UPI0035953AA1
MKRHILVLLIFFVASQIAAQLQQSLNNKYQLAQSFEQDGQLEKAASLFLELYNAQPNNPIYLEDLNRVYLKQKKYDLSVQLLLDGIKARPTDITLYGLLGSTYFIMDDKDKAHEAWDNGIKSNSESITAYRLMANYALQNRDFETAVKYLKEAKRKSADPLIFSYDLANIYSSQMDFASAMKEYCELLVQKPNQIDVVKARIQNYISRPGSLPQSLDIVNNFLKSSRSPVLYDLLAFLYMQADNYEAALNSIIKYDELINSQGVRLLGFAQEAMRNNKYEQATKAYKLIIDKYKNSSLLPIAHLGYTKTLEALTDQKYSDSTENWKPYKKLKVVGKEDYLKVIDAYKSLININNNSAIKDEAVFRMAMIYKDKLLDFYKADSLLTIDSKLSPSSEFGVKANIELGKVKIYQGELKSAADFFEKVEKNPRASINLKNEAAYYNAKILFWSNKFKEALSKLNQVQSNLAYSFANDAIALSFLISISKNDSTALSNYAAIDLLTERNKISDAIEKIKDFLPKLSSFILKDLITVKYAELLIAENNYPIAIKILEGTVSQKPASIYSDKSMFLLGKIYQFAINDRIKALENYTRLLESFPNSLYLEEVREQINALTTKGG